MHEPTASLPPRSRRLWLGLGAALLVIVIAGGAVLALRQPAYAFHGGEFIPPQPAPALDLTDQSGEPFTLAQQAGSVTLVYFGYSTCPDLCPTTLADFTAVKTDLGPEADAVDFILVTFDPERDTQDRLAQYLSFFDEAFIGLRGDDTQTQDVLKNYGVTIKRVEHPESATGYLIDHTALIYVIDQQGRLRLSYPYGTPPADMAADIRHLLATD